MRACVLGESLAGLTTACACSGRPALVDTETSFLLHDIEILLFLYCVTQYSSLAIVRELGCGCGEFHRSRKFYHGALVKA